MGQKYWVSGMREVFGVIVPPRSVRPDTLVSAMTGFDFLQVTNVSLILSKFGFVSCDFYHILSPILFSVHIFKGIEYL